MITYFKLLSTEIAIYSRNHLEPNAWAILYSKKLNQNKTKQKPNCYSLLRYYRVSLIKAFLSSRNEKNNLLSCEISHKFGTQWCLPSLQQLWPLFW